MDKRCRWCWRRRGRVMGLSILAVLAALNHLAALIPPAAPRT
jgi:hypothetical protein